MPSCIGRARPIFADVNLVNRTLIAVALSAVGIVADPHAQTSKRDASRAARSVIEVSATAYCIKGETYAGTRARRGIVASDPDVIPIGSIVRVEGLPRGYSRTYRVEDTGRAIKGREIDIFVADCDAAERFGRQDARVRIVRRPPPER